MSKTSSKRTIIRRTYSERMRIECVATARKLGNVQMTARITGIPFQTIHAWLKREDMLDIGVEKPAAPVANKVEPDHMVSVYEASLDALGKILKERGMSPRAVNSVDSIETPEPVDPDVRIVRATYIE